MLADEQKIHKRLEKEIHPQEIVVHAITREDVWGLRCVASSFSSRDGLWQLISDS